MIICHFRIVIALDWKNVLNTLGATNLFGSTGIVVGKDLSHHRRRGQRI